MWQKPTAEWKPTEGDYLRVHTCNGEEKFMLIGEAEYLCYDPRKGGSWTMSDWGCGCCSGGMATVTHVWPVGEIGDLLADMRKGFTE